MGSIVIKIHSVRLSHPWNNSTEPGLFTRRDCWATFPNVQLLTTHSSQHSPFPLWMVPTWLFASLTSLPSEATDGPTSDWNEVSSADDFDFGGLRCRVHLGVFFSAGSAGGAIEGSVTTEVAVAAACCWTCCWISLTLLVCPTLINGEYLFEVETPVGWRRAWATIHGIPWMWCQPCSSRRRCWSRTSRAQVELEVPTWAASSTASLMPGAACLEAPIIRSIRAMVLSRINSSRVGIGPSFTSAIARWDPASNSLRIVAQSSGSAAWNFSSSSSRGTPKGATWVVVTRL